MKKILIAAIALTITFLYYSCKKDKKQGCMDPISIKYDSEAQEDDNSCIYGGSGGNITIVAKPQHHGEPITNKYGYPDSAFVKYNAINSPGSAASNYDLIIAGEQPVDTTVQGEDHVHILNLKPGRYYIYMTGWDSSLTSISPSGARVRGGIPVTISENSLPEVDVIVPVTEE
jgi:hypothetical protein